MLRTALAAAGGLALAAAAGAAIQTVTIGEAFDGGAVNLAPGDTLEVRLSAGPSGCAWTSAFSDAAVVKLEPAAAPGAATFRYRALATGSTSIGLACLKAAEPTSPPGALFRVQALVKESVLPRGLILEDPDSGSTIYLVQGEVLQVRLPSNPSTGYSWALVTNAPSVLRPTAAEPKYDPPAKTVPGAGGTQTFEFRVVGGGAAFLDLVYRRPSEKEAPPARRWGVFVASAAIGP
jgi:inhibitor of cysteine peptidase